MTEYRFLLLIPILALLAACGGKTPVQQGKDEFNPETSFNKANQLAENKDYEDARNLLTEVKNRDLSKKYAPLAQLRIADLYVQEGEPELAVAEYRRFLEMYPDHRNASYAQYQIAMVYFNQIEGPERGYGGAARALAEFEQLKRSFPRNPYKEIVDIRIEQCRNTIADYEFLVGEFYRKKGSYNAAINRYEGLLAMFPDYKKADKILLGLGASYTAAGDIVKAKEYLNRLIESFPSSPYVPEAKKSLAVIERAQAK